MGRLFREIIQQNPSNPPLHPSGYPQLFVLLCFSVGWFLASRPPLTGPWHCDTSAGAGANGEAWELMEGGCHSKLGYSELQYLPACPNINLQKASESVNNLHAMYHVVFGSENKGSVVDSLTDLNLIRILMLSWQHFVAEVTPLASVAILVSFIWGKGSKQGETHCSTRLADSAPGSVQPALLRLSFSCIDLKETNSHFFLFMYIESSSNALGKDKVMWGWQLSRPQSSVLSGKKCCRVAEIVLCMLRQMEH